MLPQSCFGCVPTGEASPGASRLLPQPELSAGGVLRTTPVCLALVAWVPRALASQSCLGPLGPLCPGQGSLGSLALASWQCAWSCAALEACKATAQHGQLACGAELP